MSNLYLLCPIKTCPSNQAILLRSSGVCQTVFCACPQTVALEFVPRSLERPYPHLVPAIGEGIR